MLKIKSALLACALVSGAAFAGVPNTHVETGGFTLDMEQTGFSIGNTEYLSLLSDANNVAKVSLWGLQDWSKFALDSAHSELGLSTGDSTSNALNFTLRAGYKVTNIAFSATLVGTSLKGAVPSGDGVHVYMPGVADNQAWMNMSIWTDNALAGSFEFKKNEFNGSQELEYTLLNNKAMDHDFAAQLGMSSSVTVGDTYWYRWMPDWDHSPIYDSSTSSASMQLLNPTLTITYAAAVPEPETYGMMLAGLALLGAVARRRKPL